MYKTIELISSRLQALIYGIYAIGFFVSKIKCSHSLRCSKPVPVKKKKYLYDLRLQQPVLAKINCLLLRNSILKWGYVPKEEYKVTNYISYLAEQGRSSYNCYC